MDKKKNRKFLKKFLLISVILMTILLLIPSSPVVKAADDDSDGMTNDQEMTLLIQYAPILYFKAGENFFPVDCTYFLNNSEIWEWSGAVRTLVEANPTLDNIDDGYSVSSFLDYAANYTDILGNYTANLSTWGYKYYGRVINISGYLCLQYWFFYMYNDHSLNQHEGDWETIVILLDSITGEPQRAAYSQHYVAQVAAWNEIEKTGNHSHVYVALGSHANYFRPCQGKFGLENDEVGNDGFQLPYDHLQLEIELLGEKGAHNASQNWLEFEGRWGDWLNLYDAFIGFAGPHTPGEEENQAKWVNPVIWATTSMSVNSTWFMLSCFMSYLLWIFLGIFAGLCLWKVYKAIKNRTSGESAKLSTVLGGRAAFGVFLGLVAMGITVAIIFLPWYRVYIDISGVISAKGDIILIDGMNGIQANLLVGGSGMSPLFNVAIPFYIILGTGIVLTFLDIIGATSAKKLGTKFITSGLIFIILLITMLVLMWQLGSLVSMIAPMFNLSPAQLTEIQNIMNAISAAPFGGKQTFAITGLGNVDFIWGFMIGGWLLLAAAIVKIVAGITLRTTPEEA
ncbi:MAG: hypothetical protein ACFFD2_05135 [Promethearchaeota archaeon]